MSDDKKQGEGDGAKSAAKRRSVAIALMLGAMVLLFYAATIVRLGGNAMNKGLTASPATVEKPAAEK